MRYNTISNDPTKRSSVTYSWVYWDDVFSDEEMKKIVELCEAGEMIPATVRSGEAAKDVRSSNVGFHFRDKDTAWIFDRLNSAVKSANDMFYGFDLNGYDSFQYTVYNSDTADHYSWHADIGLGDDAADFGGTRKLSMTLLLNDDFEGGEFELNLAHESDPVKVDAKKGRAVFFPSFLIHRVKPVTSGTRRSLVIWVLGPKFV